MFYNKNFAVKKPSYRKMTISFDGDMNTVLDDSILPINVPKLCYNCTGKNGALSQTQGIGQLKIPYVNNGIMSEYEIKLSNHKILRCWQYKRTNYQTNQNDDRLLLYCDDKKVYEVSLVNPSGIVAVENLTFESVPTAINYKLNDDDVILFSSITDNLTVYDGVSAPYSVPTAPKISSMCLHYERLFATGDDNVLWFSDDLNPTNWNVSLDQAGYIEFADDKGKLVKVVSFLDYVYIFRQYGITRLTAYADQEEFYASEIYATSGRIYPQTVAVCGDIIYFLCQDGLYCFDGNGTKKIMSNLDNIIDSDNSGASACFCNNKYVLSCKIKFDDKGLTNIIEQNGNNCLLTIDINNREVCLLRGANFGQLATLSTDKMNNALICFSDNKQDRVGTFVGGGKIFDLPMVKCWLSPETCLNDSQKDKVLKYMSVYTKTDITVILKINGDYLYYNVSGKNGYQKVLVGARGELMEFAVVSTSEKICVKPIELVFVSY